MNVYVCFQDAPAILEEWKAGIAIIVADANANQTLLASIAIAANLATFNSQTVNVSITLSRPHLRYSEFNSVLIFMFCECSACDCNVYGSLSMFCGSSSGQCQCRRGYDGKKCDECRVGFFGFPDCEECNCHVSGMKPIVGLMSGCNSSLAVRR